MSGSINVPGESEIQQIFRTLWRDHSIWTHMYVDSYNLDDKNTSYIEQRILKNLDDFKKELQKYYSNDDAVNFDIVMRDHILLGFKYLIDYKAGNTVSANIDYIEWIKNADILAERLSKMNPYWKKNVLQDLLRRHVELSREYVIRQADKIISPGTDAEEEQTTDIADYMAQGIERQFKMN